MSAEENPAAPSPTATTGARSPPWRSRRETGRRVGRLRVVVGDRDELSVDRGAPRRRDRETRLFPADVAGLDRRSSRQSRRLGGHGRERRSRPVGPPPPGDHRGEPDRRADAGLESRATSPVDNCPRWTTHARRGAGGPRSSRGPTTVGGTILDENFRVFPVLSSTRRSDTRSAPARATVGTNRSQACPFRVTRTCPAATLFAPGLGAKEASSWPRGRRHASSGLGRPISSAIDRPSLWRSSSRTLRLAFPPRRPPPPALQFFNGFFNGEGTPRPRAGGGFRSFGGTSGGGDVGARELELMWRTPSPTRRQPDSALPPPTCTASCASRSRRALISGSSNARSCSPSVWR